MFEFFEALADPQGAFLRNAVWVGLISAVPFGMVGAYVVVRRISYIAAAIAHSVLGGVGAAVYFKARFGWEWLDPGHGALFAAIFSALLIGWVTTRFRQREDAVIGAIWVTGMAAGLVFLARAPGYFDPMAYLFGDILLVGSGDLVRAIVLGGVIVAALTLFHRQIIALALDLEFAAVRGLRVECLHYGMLILTALTIVLMVQLIGIILVVALLTLPPAIASVRAKSVGMLVVVAVLLNAALVFFGLWLGYALDWPGGPAIILLAALVFVLSLLGRKKGA